MNKNRAKPDRVTLIDPFVGADDRSRRPIGDYGESDQYREYLGSCIIAQVKQDVAS